MACSGSWYIGSLLQASAEACLTLTHVGLAEIHVLSAAAQIVVKRVTVSEVPLVTLIENTAIEFESESLADLLL